MDSCRLFKVLGVHAFILIAHATVMHHASLWGSHLQADKGVEQPKMRQVACNAPPDKERPHGSENAFGKAGEKGRQNCLQWFKKDLATKPAP